jgi:hypothetical protein
VAAYGYCAGAAPAGEPQEREANITTLRESEPFAELLADAPELVRALAEDRYRRAEHRRLNFRVSAGFRRESKTYAAAHESSVGSIFRERGAYFYIIKGLEADCLCRACNNP